jgi:uncharacterized membrane protein
MRATHAADATEEQAIAGVEVILGRLLMTGVTVATALLCAGLGLWLLSDATAWSGRLIDWGLIALMGTPMLRVVVSLAEYIRLRDWFFVFTTLAVVGVLVGTLLVALRAN